MRRFLFEFSGFLILVFTLLLVVPSVMAQSDSDTTSVEEEKIKKPSGSLSIKIDESGIRVIGDEGADTTDAEPRIIFDSGEISIGTSRRYREKGNDIVKFGEDVHVEAEELVRGDIVVFGGDVDIEGKVVGNVVIMAGDAAVRSGAEINGDVVVLGGVLEEEPEVIIHGERVMFKDFGIPFKGLEHFMGYQGRLFQFFFVPVQFFISLILSFLILLFIKERVLRGHEHVLDSFLKSFGTGLLVVFIGCFAVTFLAIILLITIIGIPLAFVLVVSCVAIFIIARTVFVYALGLKVNERLKIQTTNPFAVVFIGTAVLYLPAFLGYAMSVFWVFGGPLGGLFKLLGLFLSMFAYLVGVGALFLSRFGARGVPGLPPAPPEPAPATVPVAE